LESVKEQRVDGTSDFINLVSVRCTLVAGKPVFKRKIQFYFDNRRVVMGLLEPKAFIHSTRPTQKNFILNEQINNTSLLEKPTTLTLKKLDPWFITGFTLKF
jgi:hypothetical protein